MDSQHQAVLLDGIRTPFGRYLGGLASVPARTLIATAIAELIRRYPAFAQADGVLLGQVLQAGQGQNPARLAAADGGVDWRVPALTLNNVCLAGLASVADAARRIQLGEGSRYIVGGGDSMSRAPHARLMRQAERRPGELGFTDIMINDGLWCSLGNEGMGPLSERANRELNIARPEQDAYAAASHQRAAAAVKDGFFDGEIVPVAVPGGEVSGDEGIRADTTVEKLAGLRAAFEEGGSITAGSSSQMTDGASAGLVCSQAEADALGVTPLGRIIGWAEVAGPDNTLHLKPANAIERAVARAGIGLNDVDVFEINEAFAAVVIATCRHLNLPAERVNVNGGAIALGHPLGGTGFRLLLTVARELKRRQGRYAVASLCGGGGQGYAVVIERTS
ncbi:acetyl-CoA C-acyltransferase [Alloalcanivorax mobilis]|uniref:acetyl-CoA C-acyltransferase n=1 Tax=Alloalcanivorax mobilis TaxID=2019569 RepID=UPI000B5B11F8|nr:acetyl-CoA C-acyltransferase [Alloalcanivorax mobilis]ASK36296.1 acetyl-CoA acetyltransferase [Alcanivorax sp. N3-2A]